MPGVAARIFWAMSAPTDSVHAGDGRGRRRDALAVGGVDGTLRRRYAGTAAANNLRGKTGTIDQVSALSGYVTTVGGEPVIFSLVVNGVPGESMRVRLIDDIVLNVVNFNGKID